MREREVRDVRIMSLIEEESKGDEEMSEGEGVSVGTVEAGKLSGGDEKNERGEGEVEEVAMLFLEKEVEDEEDEEEKQKEDILYGVIEEVKEQTVTVRMSPFLVQSVEAAAFKADVDATQATFECHSPCVGDIVKVLPICLSLADKWVQLDVDVEGVRYLKFVEANAEFEIEGLICGIESHYATVVLSQDIFGKLEISELAEGGGEMVQGKS